MQMTLTSRGVRNSWMLESSQVEWLKEAQHKYTDKELARLLGISYSSIRSIKSKYGIKKQQQDSWTQKDFRFLVDNYKSIGDTELSQILKRTKKSIEKKRRTNGLKRTKQQIENIAYRNNTKKQNLQIWKNQTNGYWMIHKQGEPQFLHRHIWEEAFGKIQEGHTIAFFDSDQDNYHLDNLYIRKGKGRNLDRMYVDNWIRKQRNIKFSEFIAKAYDFITTPYGCVKLDLRKKSHRSAKQKLEAINDRCRRKEPRFEFD